MGILKIPLATPGNFAKMMIQYQAWVNSEGNQTSNNNINLDNARHSNQEKKLQYLKQCLDILTILLQGIVEVHCGPILISRPIMEHSRMLQFSSEQSGTILTALQLCTTSLQGGLRKCSAGYGTVVSDNINTMKTTFHLSFNC